MTCPHLSSSGLSRGSSRPRARTLAVGWMAGTSPAMTAARIAASAKGIQLEDARDRATGEIVTTWEARASGATEVKR